MDTMDNFTNDSSMMISWERAMESKCPDALFSDPLAEALTGSKGEVLPKNFEAMCTQFELEGLPGFHKSWVAVRRRFIDDRITECAETGDFSQIVNLGG